MKPLKRTKIVATISDKNLTPEFLTNLYDAGMDVVRLNTAHLTPESCTYIIDMVRSVSETIAILIDTKGPEIRTTVCDSNININDNKIYKFTGEPTKKTTEDEICVSYPNFVNELEIGGKILIDDGELEFQIIEKKDSSLICKALNAGSLGSRKSINVPGAKFNLPSLTDRDREFVEYAIEKDLEFIAHSFVRHKQDCIDIQEILDKKNSKVKIIAKIENQEGVENIDEILDHCYGVMVARGDLGIEIPAEKIPGIQRSLIDKCIENRKPVIIATQMLHTMIEHPRPTRAEVTDVANAIYQGTDAVMLSGETAYGRYALEAVQTMTSIAMETEATTPAFRNTEVKIMTSEISAFLTQHAVKASNKLNCQAIVADSCSGRTIRNLTSYRGIRPIFALCYSERTMRELSLSYGVYPHGLGISSGVETKDDQAHSRFIYESIFHLVDKKHISEEDTIVVVSGNYGTAHGASFIEISNAKNLTKSIKK